MGPDIKQAFLEMMAAWQKTYGAYSFDETNKPQMVEIMNLIEGPLKTLVAFAKHLPRFRRLHVNDQISLLKVRNKQVCRKDLYFLKIKCYVATSNDLIILICSYI